MSASLSMPLRADAASPPDALKWRPDHPVWPISRPRSDLARSPFETDAKGDATGYAYESGRRTGMSNANVSLAYGYDTLNRRTSVTNSTYNLSVAYAYDAAGNRTQLQTKTGTTVLNQNDYTYNAKNRLVQLTNSKLGAFRFAYDPMDRRTSLQYPNGITSSYAYDKAYRLSAIVSKNSSNQILDAWSYQYDSVGNRTTKTDMDGNVETYGYDNVYRLTDAHYSGGMREAFTYDPVGNRLTQLTETGQTLTYSYDIANQLLTAGSDAFTYDANGNTKTKTTSAGTTNFTYDIKNRLTAIAGPDGSETSIFAPDNTRVRMVNSSLTGDEHLIYDTVGNPVFTSGSGSYEYSRVYGPGVDELLGEWKGENSRRFYTHEALGSITVASDDNGAVRYKRSYRPFGRMSSTAASDERLNTRFGYTGREISVGSTMQYRTRHYDSAYGRFLQQDSYRGDDNTPPSLQQYVYAINAPVNYIDPDGRASQPTMGGLLGAVSAIMILLAFTIGAIGICVTNLTHNLRSAAAWSCAIGIGSLLVRTTGIAWLVGAVGFVFAMADFINDYIMGYVDKLTMGYIFAAELFGNGLAFYFGMQAGDGLYKTAIKYIKGKETKVPAPDLGTFYSMGALAIVASYLGDWVANAIESHYMEINHITKR